MASSSPTSPCSWPPCRFIEEEDFGLNALAGALLPLTIANLRNAWDLMLTMVRRHHQND